MTGKDTAEHMWCLTLMLYAYDDYHSNVDMCTEYDDIFVDLKDILELQE